MGITEAELKNLITKWERPKVDFKRELRLRTKEEKREFARDVCAIANSEGGVGYLIVGFDDKKRLVGMQEGRLNEEQLQQIVSHSCDPPIDISAQMLRYKSKWVGVIEIPPSPLRKPHQVLVPGGFYIRDGSTTRVMSVDEIMRAMLRRREIESGRQGEYDELSINERAKRIRNDAIGCFQEFGFRYSETELRAEGFIIDLPVFERDKDRIRFYCMFLGDNPSLDNELTWRRTIDGWWSSLDPTQRWFNGFCLFTSGGIRRGMIREQFMTGTMNVAEVAKDTYYKGIGEVDDSAIEQLNWRFEDHVPRFFVKRLRSRTDIRDRIGALLDFIKRNKQVYKAVKRLKELEKCHRDREDRTRSARRKRVR